MSWLSMLSQPRYELLKTEPNSTDIELSEADSEEEISRQSSSPWVRRIFLFVVPSICIVILILGLVLLSTLWRPQTEPVNQKSDDGIVSDSESSQPASTIPCPRRREWRTLSTHDQQSYIAAVKCLLTQPSELGLPTPNVSLYSDFPYLHAHVGYKTHHSAAFLPWHRYLLHVFEAALSQRCHYEGGLVYWDWTLDSHDLVSSPVFDPDSGFGGDGDPNSEITVGRHGRCVTDGPFAGTQVLWYDVKYQPHCLSRGFRTDQGSGGGINGDDVSKETIDKIMDLPTYEEFVKDMEAKVHDAIPFGVGGDFETFSAPFDPLFYLHHVQLDRLWWLWQHRDVENRFHAYGGHKERHSIETAKLSDSIHLGGLASDIEVRQVMETCSETGLLSYTY